MEKIFDKEVEKYLKESGVSNKEISKIKFNKLKENGLKRLKEVIGLIEKDDYNKIQKLTASSPSGDGYGCDNDYINFGDIIGAVDMDILELSDMLQNLKRDTE
jgi:hypothetical protein